MPTTSWPRGRRPCSPISRPWTWRRATANAELEATALNNLGETYLVLGDWETALKHFRQALPIIHRLGDRSEEAKTLINVGQAFQRLKRFDEARKAFDQALALARALKDPETQTFALTTRPFSS